jgi:hypothetical protein
MVRESHSTSDCRESHAFDHDSAEDGSPDEGEDPGLHEVRVDAQFRLRESFRRRRRDYEDHRSPEDPDDDEETKFGEEPLDDVQFGPIVTMGDRGACHLGTFGLRAMGTMPEAISNLYLCPRIATRSFKLLVPGLTLLFRSPECCAKARFRFLRYFLYQIRA